MHMCTSGLSIIHVFTRYSPVPLSDPFLYFPLVKKGTENTVVARL